MRSRSTLTPRSRLKTKARGFSCGARKNINIHQLYDDHWTIGKEGNLYNMRRTLAEEGDRRQSIHGYSGKPNVTPSGEKTS